MAAQTEQATRRIRDKILGAFETINADTVFAGSLAAIGSPANATATSRGRALPYQVSNEGEIPIGRALQNSVGDTAASPIPEAELALDGYVLEDVDVAGASSVNDSVGRLVYSSTDNPGADLTLTRAADQIPLGWVRRYRTGDNCDVEFFSASEIFLAGMSGNAKYTWHLGTVVAELGAAADLLTGIEAPHHGAILSTYAICASAPVDADVNMDVELEIDGVNLTGGTITLNFADATGAKKAGTAVTATNVFHEGDLIDVEALAAGFVAGTAGDGVYNIYAEVEPRPGS